MSNWMSDREMLIYTIKKVYKTRELLDSLAKQIDNLEKKFQKINELNNWLDKEIR